MTHPLMYCRGNPLSAVIILIKIQATPVPSNLSSGACGLFLLSRLPTSIPEVFKVSTSCRLLGSRSGKELAPYSHETLLLAAALELGLCCCLLRQMGSLCQLWFLSRVHEPLKSCILTFSKYGRKVGTTEVTLDILYVSLKKYSESAHACTHAMAWVWKSEGLGFPTM